VRGDYSIQPPYAQPVDLILYNLFAGYGYSQAPGLLHDKPLHITAVDAGNEEGCARVELVPLN